MRLGIGIAVGADIPAEGKVDPIQMACPSHIDLVSPQSPCPNSRSPSDPGTSASYMYLPKAL
jgi:hypothetical protein